MKKLMILAVVAMSAVCSQALSVSWSASKVYKYSSPTSSTKAGNETKGWWVNSSDYALADAKADLAKGNIQFLKDYGTAGWLFNNGNAISRITSTAAAGDTFTGYVVILDNTDMAKATYAYITPEERSATARAGQNPYAQWYDLSETATASNWKAVNNVPEPTSAMLLLLGVAGLALKRKQK